MNHLLKACALWLANASPLRLPQPIWFRRDLPRILKAPFVGALRRLMGPFRDLGPPSGSVSAFEELRGNEGPREGRIILEGQGNPTIPSPSIMVESSLGQHQNQPMPVFWSRFPEARLLSQSLALIDGRKWMVEESGYGAKFFRKDPAYRCLMIGGPRRLDGPWTSLVSEWVPTRGPTNYAHWLLDALPRLGVLDEFPAETRIIVPGRLLPFQEDSLRLLGLEHRCQPTPETFLSVEDYYFSSPTSMIVCYNPYGVEFLRSRFLKFADASTHTPRRFFLRRTGSTRNLVNEAEVFEFFESMGWAIVDATHLTFTQQIRLFSEAEAICSIHGAGLANAAWCRPGCCLVELFSENFLSGCYEWLCQVVGVRHHYMIFEGDYMRNARVDLVRLRPLLQLLGLC